jgi:uncharacterized membrane protein
VNAAAPAASLLRRTGWSRLGDPATLFVLISLVIGAVTIAITPPLRGPDESAHFLRAYGYWLGDILPRQTDALGRQGLLIPSAIERDYAFFETERQKAGKNNFSYRPVMTEFRRLQAEGGPPRDPWTFVFFGGSEGYAPVAYVPYTLAAGIAHMAQLDFLPMLFLMRIAGLIAFTALAAYAIARTPVLPWCFFAVALVPSSAFARAVVSADPAVLGTTLLVLALSLDAALNRRSSVVTRAIWMTLCTLTKPSQVAFVLLELMVRPLHCVPRALPAVLCVALPGVVLSALWVVGVGAEMAAWRLYHGTDVTAEQFSVVWKTKFMLTHPLHLPSIMWESVDYLPQLGRQLIGILGWLDMGLHFPAYPVIAVLLILASLGAIKVDGETRRRIAWIAALTTFGYFNFVAYLLFVTSTPTQADRLLGIQGRYYVMLVPLLALVLAAMLRRAPTRLVPAAAIACALVSSIATVEAVLRSEWR